MSPGMRGDRALEASPVISPHCHLGLLEWLVQWVSEWLVGLGSQSIHVARV